MIGFGPFLAKYGEMFGSWSGKILLSVSKSGGALAAAVLSLFLIPIITFYMLRDWDSIMARLGALVPESQRETVFQLARESDDVLGAFLRGQLLVMLALAVIYSLGLSIVGLKFAIAIGVVSGLVSFVPYLGFVFGIAHGGYDRRTGAGSPVATCRCRCDVFDRAVHRRLVSYARSWSVTRSACTRSS